MNLQEAIKTITPEFSISESAQMCSKHHVHMKEISVNGRVIVSCDQCQREKVEKEDRMNVIEAKKRLTIGKTYGELERLSLIGDSTLKDASFGNYEPSSDEAKRNKQAATESFIRLKKGEVFNLWFAGNPGVGKSHLAMSILRNLNEIGRQQLEWSFKKGDYSGGYKCLFINFDMMLRMIRDSFNDRDSEFTESYFVDLLSGADYLVIDDLGAESGAIDTGRQASDFVHRVLYAVSNERQDKPTIITTNLSGSRLMKTYDQKIMSRLFRNMQQIVFKQTPDHRAAKLEF